MCPLFAYPIILALFKLNLTLGLVRTYKTVEMKYWSKLASANFLQWNGMNEWMNTPPASVKLHMAIKPQNWIHHAIMFLPQKLLTYNEIIKLSWLPVEVDWETVKSFHAITTALHCIDIKRDCLTKV